MSKLEKETEQHIEHQVKLCFNSNKFDDLENRMYKIDQKLNFIIGIMIGLIIWPIAMKYLHLL